MSETREDERLMPVGLGDGRPGRLDGPSFRWVVPEDPAGLGAAADQDGAQSFPASLGRRNTRPDPRV